MCELLGTGVKVDKGFKEVHVNKVASFLREFIGEDVTGSQVYNRLGKWRQRWARVCNLKNLSWSLWDSDGHMITLEEEHYLGHCKVQFLFSFCHSFPLLLACITKCTNISFFCFHVLQDHPKDAKLLNKPIQHYEEMETLFGGGMATGRYAMGYGEALGVFSGFGDSVDKKPVINIKSDTHQFVDLASTEQQVDQQVEQKTVVKPLTPTEASKAATCCAGQKRKRAALSEEEVLVLTNMIDAVNNIAHALRETGPE
jgi:hypothetical protein